MRYLYTFFLTLWAFFYLPVLFWQKKSDRLSARLGFHLPRARETKKSGRRIWIHAVSLGEMKAAAPLIDEIRKEHPDAQFYISSATTTGLAEAKKAYPHASSFLLPLDFPFLMRKLVQAILPDLFILMESDFWYNLLHELKKQGAKIALVNGKLSQTSAKRHKILSLFAKRLFNPIDLFCLQSEEHKALFSSIGIAQEKIVVTGNVKFDIPTRVIPFDFHLPQGKKIVAIVSTHEGEEEMILTALEGIGDHICLLIAPRHPERFPHVSALLKKRGEPYRILDEPSDGQEKVILINKMGIIDPIFKRSHAAIIGGSFVSFVGGHNIYEPARLGVPVLFGPHMYGQRELTLAFERHNISGQTTLENLKGKLQEALNGSFNRKAYENLAAEMQGATTRSWNLIKML